MKEARQHKKAGWIGRFCRDRRGAVLVEFALVAAPFFIMIGCILETGAIMFTEYTLQNAVHEAGRLIRTGRVTDESGTLLMTEADFRHALCNRAAGLANCTTSVKIQVRSAANFTNLAILVPDMNSAPQLENLFQPGGTTTATAVIATYDWNFVFPFMNFLGNAQGGNARQLAGISIFRNEPF